MPEQHLPTYIHEFEHFTGWITEESDHYIFHYTGDSEASRDIKKIKTVQEESFSKIVSTLGVPVPSKKIEYYFYPDAETKKKLMGDEWYAQSIYEEFRIHALYTREHKPIGPHEDTHLLTLPWGLSWNFLQEGLAEYMVGHCWDGTPHLEKVREGREEGKDLRPSRQFTSQDWYDTPDEDAMYYYALAGSWVAFLIETYGLETFVTLYKATNRSMSAGEIREQYAKHFGKALEELEEQYLSRV